MNINDIPFKLKNINVFKIKSPKDTITMIEGKTLFMEKKEYHIILNLMNIVEPQEEWQY